MQNGLFFALFGSISWAINSVLVRRLSYRTGESFTATATSIFFGVPFFAVVLLFTGEWDAFTTVSARAYITLAASGIVGLVAGRWLNYYAFQRIGANKAGPLVSTTPLYTVIFAVIFLDEQLSAFLAVGVICIMIGVILITREKSNAGQPQEVSVPGGNLKGVLAALGAALCYGTSSAGVKYALNDTGSPYISVFIFFSAAAVVTFLFFTSPRRRRDFSGLRADANIMILIASALFSALSQLFIYIGLDLSPASRAIPLYSTNVLVVFLISFLFNRKLELFTWKIFLGMLAVILGAYFVFR
jgi:drug/metabolite transporter (DMT)-like permease